MSRGIGNERAMKLDNRPALLALAFLRLAL
jgi:hypothetical protein